MIQIYPAENRFVSDHGWLKSYFSFSFAEYFDPGNMHFGPMRVLNDDTVQPGTGFGMHPHKEMEIVSIVLKGQLRHEDSTGIIHSEMNPSETEEVNFLQMWFLPETSRLQPSYEQISFDPENMKNRLLPVVSKHPASDQTASIHQDMTIYLSKLEAGKSITFGQKENRRIFFFVIEGDVLLNGDHVLKRRDSARITDVSSLTAETDKGCFVMLIDLP